MSVAYDYTCSGNTTTVFNADINLHNTLFSGQTFRWQKTSEGFFGVIAGRAVLANTVGKDLVLQNVDKSFFKTDAAHYFDLTRNYKTIIASFNADDTLKASLNYAPGIRVLNQPPFEALISFIISANNNVKRIRTIIDNICKHFGSPIEAYRCSTYAFPTPVQLANVGVEALKDCGAGYRAAYIADTAKAVADGFDLYALSRQDYLQARQRLTTLKGVGNKVADCVLLYGLGFKQAFPMDVWVKRIVHDIYGFTSKNDADIRTFAENKFGKYAGIAQQYLFYYVKENKMR